MIFDLDYEDNDDVVELYSQLGYRFKDGWNLGDLYEGLRVEKMAVFLSYSSNYGGGLYRLSQGMMYHTEILQGLDMQKILIDFILN